MHSPNAHVLYRWRTFLTKISTLSLSRVEVRDKRNRGRSGRLLRKNGELGSFIGRISRLIRAEDAHRIARTDVCASDGSQMYSHTLSTFLHPLKLRNLNPAESLVDNPETREKLYMEASANGSAYLFA